MKRTTTPDRLSPLVKHITNAWRAGDITAAEFGAAMRVILKQRGWA